MQGDGVTVKPVGGGFHEFRWTEKTIIDGKVARTWRRKKLKCDHAKAQEIKAELMYQTGRREGGVSRTFNELCDPYLEAYSHQSDVSGKRRIVEMFRERFGNSPLASLDFRTLQAYQTELRTQTAWRRKTTLSPGTVNRIFAVLKHMLHTATDWEWCGDEVYKAACKVKRLPGDGRKEKELLPDEEARLMEVLAGQRYANLREIVVVALNTGMRYGELFNLTWDRVDLLNRTVWLPGGMVKSKKGRHVPLNDNAVAALRSLPERIDGGRVFGTSRLNGSVFASALRLARIKNFRFHDLRHTAATRMARAGVPLIHIAQILGHATISMTQRYAHYSAFDIQKAVGVLDGGKVGTNLAVDGASQ